MDDLQNIYVWQKNANFLDSGIIREFMVETEWAYYLFVRVCAFPGTAYLLMYTC